MSKCTKFNGFKDLFCDQLITMCLIIYWEGNLVVPMEVRL